MSQTVNASCKDIALVTPADDGNLANGNGEYPIALVVTGTVGDIAVDTADGTTITLPAALFTAKDRFPLSVKRIYDTATTSTGIYVLYGAG